MKIKDINGFLIINKPKDITSFFAVNKIKKIGFKKVGHCGALDPFAEGILVIAIGKYTKLTEIVMNERKKYCATLYLGKTTDTLDVTGEVINYSEVPKNIDIDDIKKNFIGKYLQKIPSFSAAKINGKKFYELARKGLETPERYKEVNIYSLEIKKVSENILELIVECSRGTYIRQLAEDIGKYLGTVAYLESLKRIAIGDYDISKAVDINQINSINDVIKNLINAEVLLKNYQEIKIGSSISKKYLNGYNLYEILINNPDYTNVYEFEENKIYKLTSGKKLLSFIQLINEDGIKKFKNIAVLDELMANETN